VNSTKRFVAKKSGGFWVVWDRIDDKILEKCTDRKKCMNLTRDYNKGKINAGGILH
jgi:hypothetical protein